MKRQQSHLFRDLATALHNSTGVAQVSIAVKYSITQATMMHPELDFNYRLMMITRDAIREGSCFLDISFSAKRVISLGYYRIRN